jgi:hypothetical protein
MFILLGEHVECCFTKFEREKERSDKERDSYEYIGIYFLLVAFLAYLS